METEGEEEEMTSEEVTKSIQEALEPIKKRLETFSRNP
ncbi:hypothetical protein B4144_2512 [Bacillus atrophaeus]|nr:hypothetical protein B4144_2512 [Bacillus atrophaeus]